MIAYLLIRMTVIMKKKTNFNDELEDITENEYYELQNLSENENF